MSVFAAIGLVAMSALIARADGAASAEKANYARVAKPRVEPAFLPLPPGAVEPAGWLRDWAIAARDGITRPPR